MSKSEQGISCPICKGRGRIIGAVCVKCNGSGIVVPSESDSTMIYDEDDGYHD